MGIFHRFRDYICWIYTQYTLVTAVYMLEPAERYVFNSIILSLILTAGYTTYVYMPSHCAMIMGYLGVWDTGTPETS